LTFWDPVCSIFLWEVSRPLIILTASNDFVHHFNSPDDAYCLLVKVWHKINKIEWHPSIYTLTFYPLLTCLDDIIKTILSWITSAIMCVCKANLAESKWVIDATDLFQNHVYIRVLGYQLTFSSHPALAKSVAIIFVAQRSSLKWGPSLDAQCDSLFVSS